MLYAFLADIYVFQGSEAAVGKPNNFFASGAMCSLELRRIFKFFKIIFVRAIPYIHFRFMLEIIKAFLAFFPITIVLLIIMIPAKGKTAMITGTTIASVRKYHIII